MHDETNPCIEVRAEGHTVRAWITGRDSSGEIAVHFAVYGTWNDKTGYLPGGSMHVSQLQNTDHVILAGHGLKISGAWFQALRNWATVWGAHPRWT